ncbi:hypothetical protein [Fusobacterium russii]|uniref:hypothetical protein n=1 Tax=Fusobacterium russii TaxID=854 RepID=UPI0003A4A1E8|nr:hypothetical protein [Fusobacterium russii]
MKKITIQQAIFLLSTLMEKQSTLSLGLNSYKVPLLVNGKNVTDPKKVKQMLREIEELNLIQKDIINLKSSLAELNIKTIVDKKSINQYLEEVRMERSYLQTLNALLKSNYTKVENSVGVVQYGLLNEDYIKELAIKLEKKVNEISQKIDTINSSTYLEIELLSEK